MKSINIFFRVLASLCSLLSLQVYSQEIPSKVAHQGIYLNLGYSKYYNPFITDYYNSRILIKESYSMIRFGSGVEFYGDRWGFAMGVGYGSFGLKDMALDETVGSSTSADNYSDISFSILSLDINFCYILSESIPLGVSITAVVAGTFDSYNRLSPGFFYNPVEEKVSHSYGSGGFGFGLKYFILNNLSLNIDYLWISGEATQELGFRTSSVDESGEWGHYYPVGTGKYSWSNLLSAGVSYTIPFTIIPTKL